MQNIKNQAHPEVRYSAATSYTTLKRAVHVTSFCMIVIVCSQLVVTWQQLQDEKKNNHSVFGTFPNRFSQAKGTVEQFARQWFLFYENPEEQKALVEYWSQIPGIRQLEIYDNRGKNLFASTEKMPLGQDDLVAVYQLEESSERTFIAMAFDEKAFEVQRERNDALLLNMGLSVLIVGLILGAYIWRGIHKFRAKRR